MNANNSQIQKAFDWLAKENGENFLTPDEHCPTRDVFQARLEEMNILLKERKELTEIASFVVVVVGEIGNNAFDHNLGNWRDVPGIFFHCDIGGGYVIIADRGLGIQATLKRVRLDIQDDCQALHIAFKEIVTSRAPEKRGNGLKFVEKVVTAHNWRLDVYSGVGHYLIEYGVTQCSIEEKINIGVIAILKF